MSTSKSSNQPSRSESADQSVGAPPAVETVYHHRHRVGALGEAIACAFLRRRGCTIEGRNVKVGRGEVDIVARIDGERTVVEVKTVVGARSDPTDAFTDRKAAQVRRLGLELTPPCHRVDLVTVRLDRSGALVWWSHHPT